MKYLGIDWGLKRIGLAISEGQLASPLDCLIVTNLNDAIEKVKKVVDREKIDKVILGKPEGEMGKKVVEVAKRLQQIGIDVTLADETLSTQKAKSLMIEMGYGRKSRRDDNATSAAIILQHFLDEQT